MSDANPKLAFRSSIPRYLRELEAFLGHGVEASSLLTPQETKLLQEQARRVPRVPIVRWRMRFEDREKPWFHGLVAKLADLNSSAIYLWTPMSIVCGILREVPLRDLQLFSFPFSINAEGILTILTSDLKDQMLMDFWEDEGRWLDVELAGEHWGNVSALIPADLCPTLQSSF
jgi:hypothetical protein